MGLGTESGSRGENRSSMDSFLMAASRDMVWGRLGLIWTIAGSLRVRWLGRARGGRVDDPTAVHMMVRRDEAAMKSCYQGRFSRRGTNGAGLGRGRSLRVRVQCGLNRREEPSLKKHCLQALALFTALGALAARPAMGWNAHGHRTITRLAL